MYRHLKRILLVLTLIGAVFGGASTAHADDVTEWSECGEPTSLATGENLSTYLVVSTVNCDSDGWPFILKLKPNGSIDKSFGESGRLTIKGLANFRAAIYGQNVPSGPGFDRKLLLADDSGITRLNLDGSKDATFAAGGRLEIGPDWKLDYNNLDVLGDGTLAVAGSRTSPDGLMVGKFGPDGNPDADFGVGGIAELDVSGFPYPPASISAVSRTSEGKVAVSLYYEGVESPSGIRVAGVYLLRLTSAGEADPAYGTGGSGYIDLLPFTTCPGDCRFWSMYVSDLALYPDDTASVVGTKVTITGPGNTEDRPGFRFFVNSAGTALAPESNQDLGFTVQGLLPMGAMYGSWRLKYPAPVTPGAQLLYKTDYLGNGGFSGGKDLTSLRIAPNSVQREFVHPAPGAGAFITAGIASGVTCGPLDYCFASRRIFVSRLSYHDGTPDQSFGKNGSVVLGRVCWNGRDPGRSISGWPSCKLPKLKLDAKVGLRKRFTNRPTMTIRAVLSEFQGLPRGSAVRLKAKLPPGVSLTRKASRKVSVSSNAKGWYKWEEPTYAVRARGRDLTVSYRQPGPVSSWQGDPPGRTRFLFRVDLRPGAIKSIPRPARKGKKRVSVTAAIDTGAAEKWYVGSRDRSVVTAHR